ncbi:MAG: lysylphosphatidylglycerol synthase domain-containing protein [Acidimicrobiales bacterium]
MNGMTEAASRARRLLSGPIVRTAGIALTAAVLVVLIATVDTAALGAAARQAAAEPATVLFALAAFAGAFAIRAIAWRRVLRGLSFGQALGGIHLALGANHVLPFRLGEPFRVMSVNRRAGVPRDAATASTVTLRAADVLAVAMLGLVVAPAAFFDLIGPVAWILLVVVAGAAAYGWRWIAAIADRNPTVRLPDVITFLLSASAWLAESVLVWQAAHWAGLNVSWADAVLVTTVAVAAQIAAVAPGGFGTYEAAAVAAYATLGYDPKQALVAALAAHALKTAYSLVAGLVALFSPAPGFLGRLRLASPPATKPAARQIAGANLGADREVAPILLFMPAYNEERSVAACVRRTPDEVLGHPVQTLVIDDGSTDETVAAALAADAEVLSLEANRGLGAAVRVGLAEGVARGCVAVVFCDADGEYPPEELANLVAPILNGEADYVAGSRFLGRIDHMRPHRRFGNLVLTRLLSVIARRKISDGQTGYRAFSIAAAADAEVIHDFNYAQVLTLDLLAKGYRYREVPISYHYRTEGESFIKLGRYLRNVLPAVYRELNAA